MAQQMIDLKEQTSRALTQTDEGLEGTLSIGCSETGNMSELSDLMAAFQQRHPKVHFRIFSLTADENKERMEHGLLDMGLMTEPVSVEKYTYLRMPHRERWGILLRKDCPLAEKQVIVPEDLVGYPLLMVKRDDIQSELANWFGETYDRLNFAATYSLFINAAIMTKQRMGIALCFDIGTVVYDELCFRPFYPTLEIGSVLAWKESQRHSEVLTEFLRFLRNHQSADSSD